LALVINITKCKKEQMQLQVAGACRLAFLLKPWVWQALLIFHHRLLNMLTRTFSQANLGKMAITAVL
jgi:hypothetical protein